MLSRTVLRYVVMGCLLHVAIASGIRTKISSNSSIHTAVFSFFIIFSILTGLVFVLALERIIWPPGPGEVPWEMFIYLHDTGHRFHRLSFLAVATWLAQLVIYTIYAYTVLMRGRNFPDSAYIAGFLLGKLADVFIVASVLQLVYYRWMVHYPPAPRPSRPKVVCDLCLVVIHLGVAAYTTTFLALSMADPEADNKYLNWLISDYVYGGIYVLVVVNAAVTTSIYKRALRAAFTANPLCAYPNMFIPRQVQTTLDWVLQYSGVIIGSLVIHALFKVIMAVLFSQHNNPKINFDVLRISEVIVLGLTYFIVMLLLIR